MCYACQREQRELSFAFLGHGSTSGWDSFMLSQLLLNITPILKMRNEKKKNKDEERRLRRAKELIPGSDSR